MAKLDDEIVTVLRSAPEPMSGFQFIRAIEARRPARRFLWWRFAPHVGVTTLHLALDRLERAGVLTSEYRVIDVPAGHKTARRVYRIAALLGRSG